MAKERFQNGSIYLEWNEMTGEFWLQNGLAGFFLKEEEMSCLAELLDELFEYDEELEDA